MTYFEPSLSFVRFVRLPSLADTAYRSDDNELLCRSENIVLVSPTAGKCSTEHTDPAAITMANFRIEDRLESFLSGFQLFTVA